MLGPLLGIIDELALQRRIRFGGCPARARTGERPEGDAAVTYAHEDFRRRADEREVTEVEMKEKRRRVRAPERPVEREGRQRERRGEALRNDDLEGIAGGDVFLAAPDHGAVLGRRSVRHRLGRLERIEPRERMMRKRRIEARDHIGETMLRSFIGLGRIAARFRINGRDQRHLVLHGIEDDHHGRTHQDGIRHTELVGRHIGQLLDKPHVVIAEIAEHARGHGRQVWRRLDARALQKGAQRCECRRGLRLERVAARARALIDLRTIPEGAPDRIGFEADDRVAAADLTSLDGFEKKAQRPAIGQLEHGRDGRFEVGDEACPHELRAALPVGSRKCVERRLDLDKRGRGRRHLGSFPGGGRRGDRPVNRHSRGQPSGRTILREALAPRP